MRSLVFAGLGVAAVAADDTCTALVLAGGANCGAWQAGVLWGLMHYGDPADFEYDVVTGISAGAINSSAMVSFKKGEEKEASEFISDEWKGLNKASLLRSWPFGWFSGLFKGGLYDATPLEETLKSILSKRPAVFEKDVSIGAVDANFGTFVSFTILGLKQGFAFNAGHLSGISFLHARTLLVITTLQRILNFVLRCAKAPRFLTTQVQVL